jgi:filamentous hemagglutinin family protein
MLSSEARAQIVPAQDGTGTQVQLNGNQFEIIVGARSRDNQNLFHSFEKFGITQTQIANIQSNPTIRNIFMRVSSGDPSVIDGLLQVSGGNSNLFLMNPGGILFGANARLNLPAAFSATTATGLQFETGNWTAIGTQNYADLIGDPTQLIFGLERGIIANTGNLTASSLNLSASSIVNTGQLTARQLTLTAVPGSNRVRLSQTGNVMSLEFQPPQTVNWTPATLSQLLAKGGQLTNATQLETLPDGKVQLRGSGITISEQSGTTTLAGKLDGGTIYGFSDRTFIINPILQSNGEILLSANQQLWIQREQLPTLSLGQGEKITFRAGSEFVAGVALLSDGRSIEIQAPAIKTQTINTSLATNQQGSVTILSPDGQTTFSNIITPNQNVTIQAQRIDGQFIATNAVSGSGGKVDLQSQGSLTIGGIVTNGQAVTLSSVSDRKIGSIQTSVIRTSGGAVNLQANRINAGSIWTTPDQSENAGNVTLTAQTELTARRIEANGKGTGRAGTVSILNQGDVLVDSIQAYGGTQGGQVEIKGDRVRITGISFDQTPSSIRAGESIRIYHQGGKTNQPFIVGNSVFNGTTSYLQIGNAILNSDQFPIAEKTVEYRPLQNLVIVSENEAPIFPGLESAKMLLLSVKPGSRSQFTLAELGITQPTDPNQDKVKIYIRPSLQFQQAGGKLLDFSGQEIINPKAVNLTDQLTFIAPSQQGNFFSVFEVLALDVAPSAIAGGQYPR